MGQLEEDLVRLIRRQEKDTATLVPLAPWAKAVRPEDRVITFNYDCLAERALKEVGKEVNLAFEEKLDHRITVMKVHGSVDWVLLPRNSTPDCRDARFLFKKPNPNAPAELPPGTPIEDSRALFQSTGPPEKLKELPPRYFVWVA